MNPAQLRHLLHCHGFDAESIESALPGIWTQLSAGYSVVLPRLTISPVGHWEVRRIPYVRYTRDQYQWNDYAPPPGAETYLEYYIETEPIWVPA